MMSPAVSQESAFDMGQGYSYLDKSTPAPPQILPDPSRAGQFFCTRNGVSSNNYNVHKDSSDGPLWLFVKKTGHTLQTKEPTVMVLENFRKDVLCVARLQPKTDEDFNPTYSLSNVVKVMVEGQVEVGDTKYETIRTIAREELEWRCQTKVLAYRSHAMTELMAEMYVEAVGSACRLTQKIDGRDSENIPSTRTVFKEKKQVDRMSYVIRLAGDHEFSFVVDDPNSFSPFWNCPMFQATIIPSDDWRWFWDIKVKEGFDASLSLLLGLVCSSILRPEKIMYYLPIKWSRY